MTEAPQSEATAGRASSNETTTGEQVFYREVPVDSFSLALRRLIATNFGLRCPACGRSNVTNGVFGVKEQCAYCGSRFRRLEGNELVSIPLNFFLASVATFLVGLVLVRRYGFFDGITFALLAVGLLTVVLGWRPMRVLALWLLWIIGFVYPDDVDKGKTVRVREQQQSPPA